MTRRQRPQRALLRTHECNVSVFGLGYAGLPVASAYGLQRRTIGFAPKWNVLEFTPGRMRGHRIGVNPYYLTHRAQVSARQMIPAARRVNEGRGRAVKTLIRPGCAPLRAKATVRGLTFKENCAHPRNSKVIDIVHHLQDHRLDVQLLDFDHLPRADAAMLAVPHRDHLAKPGAIFADVKSSLPLDAIHAAGLAARHL